MPRSRWFGRAPAFFALVGVFFLVASCMHASMHVHETVAFSRVNVWGWKNSLAVIRTHEPRQQNYRSTTAYTEPPGGGRPLIANSLKHSFIRGGQNITMIDNLFSASKRGLIESCYTSTFALLRLRLQARTEEGGMERRYGTAVREGGTAKNYFNLEV